jgi:phosphatidylglycerol lysyltransferase
MSSSSEEQRPSDRGPVDVTRRLVLRHGWNATSYQIVNPGIRHWFPVPPLEGVIGWVRAAGFRVVAGAPVCGADDLPEVVAAFEDEARASRQRVCYFGAEARLAEVLAVRGPFDRVLLGAQPVWDPSAWPDRLAQKPSLRAQVARARNKGVETALWSRTELAAGEPELHRCLREWLASRGLPPLHFLVEPETLGHLEDRRLFVASRGGRVIAFLLASPIPARRGWLIEQIVRGCAAVNGTSELLLDTAFRALAAEGAAVVTLGLAPLSRRAVLPPPEHRWTIRFVLGWVRRHGRRFYDFDGLDAFKAKLLPDSWEPVWAITSEPRVTLRTLYGIAGAFSGTSPLLFLARGAIRALALEARRVGARLRGRHSRR